MYLFYNDVYLLMFFLPVSDFLGRKSALVFIYIFHSSISGSISNPYVRQPKINFFNIFYFIILVFYLLYLFESQDRLLKSNFRNI